jgi:hypothetical protein
VASLEFTALTVGECRSCQVRSRLADTSEVYDDVCMLDVRG